jgi:hypothetical protein
MTTQKAIGLLALLVSDSQLSRNLNAQLNQPGQTPDTMWNYFLGQVGSLGVAPADLTRASVEPLWLAGGVLQPQFDNSHTSVGTAFSPPLVYVPGPCPNGVLQQAVMNNLP